MANTFGADSVTVTTTPSVEGKSITSYLGIVTGSSIEFTSHSLGSFSASSVEIDTRRAAENAVVDMRAKATSEADAIVGVEVKTSLTYIGDGAGNLACLATATGTAVKLMDEGSTSAAPDNMEDRYVLPEL